MREKHVMNHLTKMEAELALHGLAPRTAEIYLGCVRRFHRWTGTPLASVDAADVKRFCVHLVQERQVSPATHSQYLAALRFLFAITLGKPEVTARLPRPRVVSRPPAVPTRTEVAAVVQAARSPRHRAAILAGYTTGLRVGEVARLRAEDIDGERGIVLVQHGKGGRFRQALVIPALLDALDVYAPVRGAGPWLFPGRDPARPVHPRTLNRYLQAAVQRAGIRRSNISYHSLRHAFATHLLDDGVSVRAIQALLGHRRLETTARYLHLSRRHLDALRPSLEELGRGIETRPEPG